jgi:hypothetical protein
MFKSEMVIQYDEKKEEHEYNLSQLYSKAFNNAEMINDENQNGFSMINSKWQDIGF